MADQKLSELTELATTPASDDEVYIRDVSEAAADESKRITVANLMAAASGATLTIIAGTGTEVFSGNAPNVWTDLDINGTVGAIATIVVLKITHGDWGATVAVRQNGDTDEFYHTTAVYGCALVTTQTDISHILLVTTDTSGVLEWKTSVETAMTIDVMAYGHS